MHGTHSTKKREVQISCNSTLVQVYVWNSDTNFVHREVVDEKQTQLWGPVPPVVETWLKLEVWKKCSFTSFENNIHGSQNHAPHLLMGWEMKKMKLPHEATGTTPSPEEVLGSTEQPVRRIKRHKLTFFYWNLYTHIHCIFLQDHQALTQSSESVCQKKVIPVWEKGLFPLLFKENSGNQVGTKM